MTALRNVSLLVLLFFVTVASIAQDSAAYKIVPAGAEYKKPKFYQWLWGRNRRVEWIKPVQVPLVHLDTLFGGLRPYQQGGGNESKSLRLRDGEKREYTMRSINKSRQDVVDPQFKGTFIEGIIQDGVSMSYPYAAFAVPLMQQAAGIPHTNPLLVYIPPHAALDTFNKRFRNDLYLVEQRPDGDWGSSENLGRFKKFASTAKVIEELLEDNTDGADQLAFVKVRLFDMLISDWDRHEDNWRWGVKDTADGKWYTPVPRDRDQAFFTKNGVLISRIIEATGLGFMQNFSYRVKHINLLNMEQRNMDRFFTNKLDLNDWIRAAKELQQSLTDAVIEQSVQGMPEEIFNISGSEIIAKLKSRRDQLETFAEKYYRFVAKEVEVTGSEKRDYFEVKRLNTGATQLNIFSLNKGLEKSAFPFYTRTFLPEETREIRLYGIKGKDVYVIHDKSSNLRLRIIGGPDKDSIVQYTNRRIHIYDDANNQFHTPSARLHLSNDSAIHAFNYEGYNYNSKYLVPYVFFNSRDRWYFGLNYTFLKHKWRRVPYANSGTIGLNYYGANRAIVASISVLYPNLIGNWDFTWYASYDALKWTNFFGTGNETKLLSDDRAYHRVRSINYAAKAGISKEIDRSAFSISALFQRVKILSDTSRYIAKVLRDPVEFESNYFIGTQLNYTYFSLNDSIVPTKGFTFFGNAGFYRNMTLSDLFQDLAAKLQVYLPLSNKVSLAIRGGAESIVGNRSVINNAQFYQHAIIGGPINIRGYRAERFWGKSSFYNQNELRYLTKIRSHLLNAKAGLFAFFDEGRVWIPGEVSNTLHTSYGGGILIAPFNKIAASITYGISKESKLLQVGVNTLF